MPTTIYCDRARHEVEESWDTISAAIAAVEQNPADFATTGGLAPGFIAVTPYVGVAGQSQTYLRASAITSYHAGAGSTGTAETTLPKPPAGLVAGNFLAPDGSEWMLSRDGVVSRFTVQSNY